MTTDSIRARIIELVPEKDCPVEDAGNHCPSHSITLADVLLAFSKCDAKYHRGQDIAVSAFGMFGFVDEKMTRDVIERWEKPQWDLTKSYDEQSEEVKRFIGEILKV